MVRGQHHRIVDALRIQHPEEAFEVAVEREKLQAHLLAAGPEAGFAQEEQQALERAGFVKARLGPRVLRTETAALAALAALSALRGDF